MEIRKTEVIGPDIMRAKLGGKVSAEVAVVKEGPHYYFVAPKGLGGIQKVPADSMTDCLHYAVEVMGEKVSRKTRKPARKKK